MTNHEPLLQHNILRVLASILDTCDSTFTVEITSDTLWTAELRLLMDDEDDETPTRSVIFASPERAEFNDAINEVCQAALAWMEQGNRPLAPPDPAEDDEPS